MPPLPRNFYRKFIGNGNSLITDDAPTFSSRALLLQKRFNSILILYTELFAILFRLFVSYQLTNAAKKDESDAVSGSTRITNQNG
jgi:hypothetical protein